MKKPLQSLAALGFMLMLFSTIATAQTQGCMPGWQWQTPINVYSSDTTQMDDYQTNIIVNTQALVTAGKLNANGSDLRFIDGCCQELCFWVESGMNTTTTSIWVRIPLIDATQGATIHMVYGNSGAADASNAACTFDLYEDFDSGVNTTFSSICGNITDNISGGVNTASWSSSGIMLSDSSFSASYNYRVESDVTAASGTWPGFYWYDEPTQKSYGLMINTTQARISVTGGGTDWCSGHNWASTLMTYTGVAGIWDHAWIATGDIRSNFPTIGAMTSNDVTHPLTGDKRIGYGGISSGSGTLAMNWIRVRKYHSSEPYSWESPEEALASFPVNIVNFPTADTNYCAGSSVTLDAGAGFSTIVWSTGDTTQLVNASVAGQYYVDVVDGNGCSSSDTINVIENVNPIVALGADTVLCAGDTLSLDAGAGYVSYLWSNASTNQIIGAVTTGTYDVTVTDTNGCVGSDALDVQFNSISASFTSSSTNLAASFTNASSGGSVYDWDFGDGNNSTDMDPSHTYATTGTYYVCLTVTDSIGCSDMTCDSIVINNVGINELSSSNFNVYPSPATDVLTIESASDSPVQFEIINLTGKMVVKGDLKEGKNDIPVEKLNSGVYVLRIASIDAVYSQQIIIE